MVRVFAHGAMGRWINPSWGEAIELWDGAYISTLAVNWKEQQVSFLTIRMVLNHICDTI